jgi:hypothetical protein
MLTFKEQRYIDRESGRSCIKRIGETEKLWDKGEVYIGRERKSIVLLESSQVLPFVHLIRVL